MNLLFLTFGIILFMLLLVAFGSKKSLIDGGWSEGLIDAVKRLCHTTNLYSSNHKKEI